MHLRRHRRSVLSYEASPDRGRDGFPEQEIGHVRVGDVDLRQCDGTTSLVRGDLVLAGQHVRQCEPTGVVGHGLTLHHEHVLYSCLRESHRDVQSRRRRAVGTRDSPGDGCRTASQHHNRHVETPFCRTQIDGLRGTEVRDARRERLHEKARMVADELHSRCVIHGRNRPDDVPSRRQPRESKSSLVVGRGQAGKPLKKSQEPASTALKSHLPDDHGC
jgi:hypothetical protein